MARKLGRPKAGQAGLTRERILAAALRLVDQAGVEALSMRRLAADLGVDPMAIYHHLPGKAAVLAGLVELVFAGLHVPAASPAEGRGDAWPEDIRAFAAAYRDLARAHPHLVLYLVTGVEASAGAVLAATERLYAALAAAGLPPRLIIRAADLIVDFLNGYALAESSGRLGQPGERQDLLARLAAAPAHFPVTHQVLSGLAEAELLADFEAELEIILAGIAALAGEREARSVERKGELL